MYLHSTEGLPSKIMTEFRGQIKQPYKIPPTSRQYGTERFKGEPNSAETRETADEQNSILMVDQENPW